jgi:hypothetical protein
MFRFHVQGLSIANLTDKGLNVLMLNSAHPRKVPNVPYHLPSLFTTTESIAEFSLPRLASILGRWAPNPTDAPRDYIGWSLSGLKLRVGETGPVELPLSTMEGREHPEVSAAGEVDWRDPNWILNARKMLPTAELRAGFRELGPDTHAIFEVHGGWIEGGKPFAEGAAQYTWHVHSNYEQAFTDTVDIVFNGAPPEIVAADCEGRPAGRIQFKDEGEAWLVNEAPSLALINMATDSECGDLLVYLEAFNTSTLKEKAAIDFKPANRFGVSVPSGVSCDALLLDERSSA